MPWIAELRGSSRRRRLFLPLYLAVIVGLTLPVVPQLWSARLLLGLPISFVWVFVCLSLVFVGVLALFLEEPDAARPSGGQPATGPSSASPAPGALEEH